MDDKNKSEKSSKRNNYLRFSGMTIQMFVIIMGGAYAGMKIDEYVDSGSKTFTAVLSILSIFVAMYFVIKDVIKK